MLRTVELSQRRFEVDAAFAYDEGEGDRSLRFWQSEAHTRYFYAAWTVRAGT